MLALCVDLCDGLAMSDYLAYRITLVILIALTAAVLVMAVEGDSPAFADFMRETIVQSR